jgi:hypothetical protein
VEAEDEGNVVEGTFDGQLMIGVDGKQYPVPANYASKSKLVEGDMLKLNITPDGFFIYKQIGPIERKNALGIVNQDEAGNYFVVADGRPFKVLLASITYFKAEPGDEVAIVIPRQIESAWAAIENVIQKGKDLSPRSSASRKFGIDEEIESLKLSRNDSSNQTESQTQNNISLIDEWSSDIEAIRREIEAEKITKKE